MKNNEIKKKDMTIEFEPKDDKQPYRVYHNNSIFYFCESQEKAKLFIKNFDEQKHFKNK